ncbi:hypothetical protein CB1_001108076 [Camelus ferus]|nr:hypothetical protein CB1_001108076 [Camelus ferus]
MAPSAPAMMNDTHPSWALLMALLIHHGPVLPAGGPQSALIGKPSISRLQRTAIQAHLPGWRLWASSAPKRNKNPQDTTILSVL